MNGWNAADRVGCNSALAARLGDVLSEANERVEGCGTTGSGSGECEIGFFGDITFSKASCNTLVMWDRIEF